MNYKNRKTMKFICCMLLLLSASLFSCMDYEDINDPKFLPKEISTGALIEKMQLKVYPVQENDYQYCENLIGDIYGRYMTVTKDAWYASFATFNASDEWVNAPFDRVYSGFYPNWVKVKEQTDGKGVTFAWAQLLRVATMHRMTDLWGPIPYSQVGQGSILVPYDSQEEVYRHLFDDLDFAIASLSDYVQANPGDKPMADYDLVYGGDYGLWIRFANSLKLRMAMRIVYADPALAQLKAEEAVSHPMGLIDDNAYNAAIDFRPNPIKIMWKDYEDARVCADIVCYMQGYNDPRMASYFQRHEVTGISSAYHGLRTGSTIESQAWALKFSAPAILDEGRKEDRILWMNAAEVAFLRAEGAMRGWTMGGSADAFYRKGVELSFAQYGVSGAEVYLADGTSVPASYAGPKSPSPSLSSITVKWNDTAGEEEKLERIMTQKWIAMWPLGQEAWSEHRRTGYPRFFPVENNRNSDASLAGKLAARIPFPPSEKLNNAANYQQAVSSLGGEDGYGTKLWWDKKTNKP